MGPSRVVSKAKAKIATKAKAKIATKVKTRQKKTSDSDNKKGSEGIKDEGAVSDKKPACIAYNYEYDYSKCLYVQKGKQHFYVDEHNRVHNYNSRGLTCGMASDEIVGDFVDNKLILFDKFLKRKPISDTY